MVFISILDMDEIKEILFLPSGEVKMTTQLIIDILVSRDNSDFLRTDEKTKIKYDNKLKYWIVQDERRNAFKQGVSLSWILLN